MNKFNIKNSFRIKKERGWDTTYWCVDLHGVITKGTYKRIFKYTFYKDAKKVLQFLTKRKDIILILYTCSHNDSISKAKSWLSKHNITFDYVNENKAIKSNKISKFSRKLYFNVLLDDKAGFEGEKDWLLVKKELEKEYKVKIE